MLRPDTVWESLFVDFALIFVPLLSVSRLLVSSSVFSSITLMYIYFLGLILHLLYITPLSLFFFFLEALSLFFKRGPCNN